MKDSTVGFKVRGKQMRFLVVDYEEVHEEDGDPGFRSYILSPEQAAEIIIELWSSLPLDYRPVPRIEGDIV